MGRYLGILGLVACGTSAAPVVTVMPPAVPVSVAEARAGALDDTWILPGVVRAQAYASVAAQVSGEIRTFDVREGQVVEEGAVIATLDTSMIKARMDRAKADLDVSYSIGDGKAAGIKARLDELSVELVRHEIRAPFRGVVAARYEDVGDSIFPGDALVDLVSFGLVEVIVDGPGSLVGDVQAGAAATVVGTDTVVGEVVGIVPAVDPRTGLTRMRIVPSEPRPWLIHGAEVGVKLPLSRETAAVVVPKAAIVRSEDGPTVLRVVEERAVRVLVTELGWSGDDALVRGNGLEAGDTVVAAGGDRLRSGALLKIEAE